MPSTGKSFNQFLGMPRRVKLPSHVVRPFGDMSDEDRKKNRVRERAVIHDLDNKSYLGTFGLSVPDPMDYSFWEPESMTTRKKTTSKLVRNPDMPPPKKSAGRFKRPNGTRRRDRIRKEIADQGIVAPRFDPWNESGELTVKMSESEG